MTDPAKYYEDKAREAAMLREEISELRDQIYHGQPTRRRKEALMREIARLADRLELAEYVGD